MSETNDDKTEELANLLGKPGDDDDSSKKSKSKQRNDSKDRVPTRVTTQVHNKNGSKFIRIPYVYRVKIILEKILYIPALYIFWCMYMLHDAGELGTNTGWISSAVILIILLVSLVIRFTDAEDFWNQKK